MARIREIGSKGKLSAEFNSVPEVFKVIEKLNWVPRKDRASDRRGSDGSFHSFDSLDEALDIFKNHPERIRQFSQNDDRLQNYETPGKDISYDVTGDFLDIDRYLEGDPENFGNMVMGNPRSIFCTINVLDTYVYFTGADYLEQRQKRILRLVDWLETQGIRCQVVASADSACLYHSVIVKEFRDPFDLNHLAIAAHPEWLRRILFLIIEQSKTFEFGYGTAGPYDNKMKKYKPEPEDGLYVYVGGYMPQEGGVDELNAQFDKVEEKIAELVNTGYTFNEEPLVIG